jgi:hypothetical protein
VSNVHDAVGAAVRLLEGSEPVPACEHALDAKSVVLCLRCVTSPFGTPLECANCAERHDDRFHRRHPPCSFCGQPTAESGGDDRTIPIGCRDLLVRPKGLAAVHAQLIVWLGGVNACPTCSTEFDLRGA